MIEPQVDRVCSCGQSPRNVPDISSIVCGCRRPGCRRCANARRACGCGRNDCEVCSGVSLGDPTPPGTFRFMPTNPAPGVRSRPDNSYYFSTFGNDEKDG